MGCMQAPWVALVIGYRGGMPSQDVDQFIEGVVARTWRKRRAAERTLPAMSVGFGLATAVLIGVAVNPYEVPGGLPVAATVGAVMLALLGLMALVERRRSGARRHSGNLDITSWSSSATPWWRSPTLLGPAVVAAMIVGRALGVFEHPAGIIAFAVFVAVVTVWGIRASGSQDPIYGHDPAHPPILGDDARSAAVRGELEPDVLELIALQAHNSERKISWCARVLGTSEADVRERVVRGRRWLEIPASEVHDLSTANWMRLTEAGRTVLIQP